MHLFWVNAIEWDDCLSKLLSSADLDSRLGLFDPVVQRLDSLADEEWLSVEDAVEVNLNVLAKEWWKLI